MTLFQFWCNLDACFAVSLCLLISFPICDEELLRHGVIWHLQRAALNNHTCSTVRVVLQTLTFTIQICAAIFINLRPLFTINNWHEKDKLIKKDMNEKIESYWKIYQEIIEWVKKPDAEAGIFDEYMVLHATKDRQ